MNRIPALKPRELIRILERAGFCFIRQKGSHRLYKRNNVRVIIPFHNKDLKKGTLKRIIKESGLTEEEFLDLM